MVSEDFIALDSPRSSDRRSEINSPAKVNVLPNESCFQEGTSQMKKIIQNVENSEVLEGDRYIENKEGQHIQTMNVEVEPQQKEPILLDSMDLVESLTTIEKLKEEPEKDQENGEVTTQNGSISNIFANESLTTIEKLKEEPVKDQENGEVTTENGSISNIFASDGNSLSGAKRARVEDDDMQPSVRVVYKSLTRESKKKLTELLQHWSEWHAQSGTSSHVSSEDGLEYGEETYFPALHVGSEQHTPVSFWLDNRGKMDKNNDNQLKDESVPLYDRGYTLVSTSLDGSTDPERIEAIDASRCFNCGSYSHSLKDCPKPRDNVAISNARKQHNLKRNQVASSRVQVRYYQKPSGKFDDLKAGVLGAETRECLGIGEFDPPPWLHRMRELGYPPGYLEVIEDENQPSGISIFVDEETSSDEKMEYEEGELPEKAEPESPEKKMVVEFPGINAPIPENADHRLWAAQPPGFSDSNPFKNRSHFRSHQSSESHRGHHHERWSAEHREDGPPCSDHGPSCSTASYSPRYTSYDYNPIPRSPTLGRSLSDRWRSPLAYDNSSNQSPHSTYSPQPPPPGTTVRQSPQYHSPTPSFDDWHHDSSYSGSPDVSSQPARERHEHRRHHSRR